MVVKHMLTTIFFVPIETNSNKYICEAHLTNY